MAIAQTVVSLVAIPLVALAESGPPERPANFDRFDSYE